MLITDLHAIVTNPSTNPNPEYFKQYNLTDESILKINEINNVIAQQASMIQNYQSPVGEKQLQIQMLQLEKTAESGIQSFDVIKKLKDSLNDTLLTSKKSQSITTWMYISSFILGMLLIVAAMVFAFLDKPILAIAFGTFGMVDIVAHFIADPPARLQESRSNYVQLIGLTLAWFKETLNNDAYIGSAGTITKEALDNFNVLSDNYATNTGRFFQMMDDLAEPKNKKTEKKEVVAPNEVS